MKKNIYALIVGIDDYPTCPLSGCVADSNQIVKYLESDLVSNHYTVHIEILHNGAAKRSNIIDGFQKHLAKAGENDIAFFYFSGHGAQEIADMAIWHEDGNRKLEGLVCHDSLNSLLLLADKELRVLINGVSKSNAHVLTIFDCCHSGGNTRGFVEGSEMTKRQFADPRMGQEFPQRKWEQFFFSKDIDLNALKSEPLNTVIPQGNQVQLAACQSDQSAYETNIQNWGKGGVFTYTLLQILNRSDGMVTYYDLKSRILHFIKNQYNQTPTIYVKGDKRGEIYKNFLGGEQSSTPLYGNLVFNKTKQQWVLDMGAIHGISKQAETVNVIVDGKDVKATIEKVNSADSIITVSETAGLSKTEAYKIYVHPFKSAPIGVFINGDTYVQATKDELANLIEEKGSNINLVAEEKLAQYTIQLDKWNYTITLANDPYRPLVLPVAQYEDNAAQKVFDQLYHISQWEFVKALSNSDATSRLNTGAIRVDMSNTADAKEIFIDNDEINMQLASVEEEGAINVRLTNTTNRKLYVAALYMGVNFEVFSDFLEAGTQLLEPNGFVDLKYDGDVNIPYFLDDYKRIFNWKKSTSYFKIIINTEAFDVNTMELEALDDPSELLETERGLGTTRGMGRSGRRSVNAKQWTTRLLSFNVHNPNYNKVDIKELEKNIQTAAAPYLAGLYMEEETGFSSQLALKKEIELITEGGLEKGFLYDAKLYIANSISREIRRFRYEKQLMLNPNITKIVSEGDSWFQYPHPKVLDVIDHLYKHYAIFSLGAGGDELKHLFEADEFMETVERENPKFLLLSGGGNDILGEEFEGFLRADITDDLAIECQDDLTCFMDDTFYKKLDYIVEMYQNIFERMERKFPDIPILIHGYDYAIPLESTEKGWLGRYMIARNMTNQTKRRKLIKYLVDKLNDRLSTVASGFSMVHYIDCRGTVADDSWWDEIHPVSEGFELVAGHFLKKLKELEG